MICEHCGNKGFFYLEQKSKETTNILDAKRVALKCGACDKFVKWCPKTQRRFYMVQLNIEDYSKTEDFKNNKDAYIKKLEQGLEDACRLLNQYSSDEPFWFKDRYYKTVYKPEHFILHTDFETKEVKNEKKL